MKSIFRPGDIKQFHKVIERTDVASFDGAVVHDVYSTFALGRDAEWTTRQFVLDMRDDDEEGVGTFLSVEHKSPAFIGEEIIFTAWIDLIQGNELICLYEARIENRLIASGKTGQKIFPKANLEKIFRRFE